MLFSYLTSFEWLLLDYLEFPIWSGEFVFSLVFQQEERWTSIVRIRPKVYCAYCALHHFANLALVNVTAASSAWFRLVAEI